MNDTPTPLPLDVTTKDGKYTVKQMPNGRLIAFRYGEAWQELTGDGLTLQLAQEVAESRAQLALASAKVAEGEADRDDLLNKIETLVGYLEWFESKRPIKDSDEIGAVIVEVKEFCRAARTQETTQ